MTDSGLSWISRIFIELFKFRKFQTLHFQQRIKRIILIYHAARRCISLMLQAATNEIEWLHSAFVFIRCTFRCIVHCINSSYSKYSLLKKASETSMNYFVRIHRTDVKLSEWKVKDAIEWVQRSNWFELCRPWVSSAKKKVKNLSYFCQ